MNLTRNEPMRWVLDTNVLLDWLIFKDARMTSLIACIESEQVRLLNRADCREEFTRVLDYPALKIDAILRAQAITTYERWHHGFDETMSLALEKSARLPLCSDADDQKFLELARDASAHWLISKDKALLKLQTPMKRLGWFEIIDLIEANRRLAQPANRSL